MSEVTLAELRQAVERIHKCNARCIDVVAVTHEVNGNHVWHGNVHVFELDGHAIAVRAYAWSLPVDGISKRHIFAVLHATAMGHEHQMLRPR
jgi:hypothetical protein